MKLRRSGNYTIQSILVQSGIWNPNRFQQDFENNSGGRVDVTFPEYFLLNVNYTFEVIPAIVGFLDKAEKLVEDKTDNEGTGEVSGS